MSRKSRLPGIECLVVEKVWLIMKHPNTKVKDRQFHKKDSDPKICRVGDNDLSSEDSSKEEKDSKEGPGKSSHLSLVESRRGTGRAERRRPDLVDQQWHNQPTRASYLPSTAAAHYCSFRMKASSRKKGKYLLSLEVALQPIKSFDKS